MSTPHCSFVIYLNNDSNELPLFIQDVRTFFQKFPLIYELIAVTEKNAATCVEQIQTAQTQSSAKEKIVLIQNQKFLGRAESLRQGLNKADGAFLLLADPQMATPLGDLFKVLQNLMTDADVNLCWGERPSKKDSPFHHGAAPRHRLERLFNAIFKERHHHMPIDVLCESGGLTKSTWQEIEKSWNGKKLRGWYLHLYIQKALTAKHKSLFIALYDSGKTSPSFSLWTARWHLLFQSIF